MGEDGHVATEAEIGAARPEAEARRRTPQPGEARARRALSRGVQRGAAPDHATISDFRPPEL